jgi:hypothetical protein
MARGNDAKAAERDLQATYSGAPNAEEMIKAQRQSVDRRVAEASLKPIDEGATAALELDDFDVNRGETIIAASVRGGYVIAVIEDENGEVLPKRLFDIPSAAKKASTNAPTPGGPKVLHRNVEPAGDDAKKAAQQARKQREEADEAARKHAAAVEQDRLDREAADRDRMEQEAHEREQAAEAARKAEKDQIAADLKAQSGSDAPKSDADAKAQAAKAASEKAGK